MKFEPPVDKAALIHAIYGSYGFSVSKLDFFPEGTVGCHYVADCEQGSRIFITLLLQGHMAEAQARRMDFNLSLMDRLRKQRLFEAVPTVISSKNGSLYGYFQDRPMILFEYIDGENTWKDWPPDASFGAELGALAARLHNTTRLLGMEIPYCEKYILPFEGRLHTCMSELNDGTRESRSGQRELRQLILDNSWIIERTLSRLRMLACIANGLAPRQVLVHTDLHGGNLVRSTLGRLYVVDWEGAMLAPPEHDLFIFAGKGMEAALVEYFRTSDNPRLNPELFAFYFYRRNLEDITEFIFSILHDNVNDDQDEHDLYYLHECLDACHSLEAEVDEVKLLLNKMAANTPK